MSKLIYVLEDEPNLVRGIANLMEKYDDVEVKSAATAGDALAWLLPHEVTHRPDVLVLDIMLPYGSREASALLDPDGSDEDDLETGFNLLRHLRAEEKRQGWPSLWVAATTARRAPRFLARLRELVGKDGVVFGKPYDGFVLEVELCRALGIECKLPKWLLSVTDERGDNGA